MEPTNIITVVDNRAGKQIESRHSSVSINSNQYAIRIPYPKDNRNQHSFKNLNGSMNKKDKISYEMNLTSKSNEDILK